MGKVNKNKFSYKVFCILNLIKHLYDLILFSYLWKMLFYIYYTHTTHAHVGASFEFIGFTINLMIRF